MNPSLARILAWGVLLGLVAVAAAVAVFGRVSQQQPEIAAPESRNVKVVVDPGSVRAGTTTTVSVRAEDGGGAPLDAWSGSALEAWVVRSDLVYATHLRRASGGATSSFPLDLRPTQPGSYRLVAAGTSEAMVTLGGAAFEVRGAAEDVPPDEQSAGREGYALSMSTIPAPDDVAAGEPVALTFTVARGDVPVAVDEQDGFRGSLVAFKEGGGIFVRGVARSSAFLPSPSSAAFAVTFPEPGRYRVFFEFKAAGRTLMDARWIEVKAAR